MRRIQNRGVHLPKLAFDKSLLTLTAILTLFGFVMIYSSSSAVAFRDFGDKFYYLKNQLVWGLFGGISLLFFAHFNYNRLIKISPLIFIFSTVLLILVLVPGIGTKLLGARRWINFGTFTFQPAEGAKLATVLFLTWILEKRESLKKFLGILLLLAVLMMAEPDLGTTVVTIATGFVIYFVSGAPITQFFFIGPGVMAAAVLAILSSSYRRSRLATFFNHQTDPLGASYHVRQALLALGSGGIFGVGLGQSRQKYLFLPEVTTDSIFAVIGEELGFVGAVLTISAFLWLILKGVSIAKQAPNKVGTILALGLVSLIAIQALINIAAMVALVPLTGVPLPFISYGGSSLIVTLSAIGILLNIARQSNTK